MPGAGGPWRFPSPRSGGRCWLDGWSTGTCWTNSSAARLEDLIRVFLVDKKWESAGGLELTDEIKVLISAMACLLVLGLPDDAYRGVKWIEVQPTTMVSRGHASSATRRGVILDADLPILGETSFAGPVFIAWDAAREGARHPERGHNVVYHEFAHKLDMDDGTVDGTPVLGPDDRQRWIEVCTAVYQDVRDGSGRPAAGRLRRGQPGRVLRRGHRGLLRPPQDLARRYPDLYDVLRDLLPPGPRGARTPGGDGGPGCRASTAAGTIRPSMTGAAASLRTWFHGGPF